MLSFSKDTGLLGLKVLGLRVLGLGFWVSLWVLGVGFRVKEKNKGYLVLGVLMIRILLFGVL